MSPPRMLSDIKRRTPSAGRKGDASHVPVPAQGARDPAPALSSDTPALDADRRETIDLMAKVLADLSDRVDGQGATLDGVNKMTAVLLRDFNDAYVPALQGVTQRVAILTDQERLGRARVETLIATTLRTKAEERRDAMWRRRGLIAGGIAALALALLVGIALPRLAAASSVGCWLMGGTWSRSDTSPAACVFWRP